MPFSTEIVLSSHDYYPKGDLFLHESRGQPKLDKFEDITVLAVYSLEKLVD